MAQAAAAAAVQQALAVQVAAQDMELNKLTRNLAHLSEDSLGLPRTLTVNMAVARKKAERINIFATPLEKISCIRSALTTLTEATEGQAVQIVSADELVPKTVE